MDKFKHFLQYNNAVPILLWLVVFSSGVTFAASEEVREAVGEAVYSAEQQVVSVDNTYIANKDLGAFSPTVRIQEVSEDDDTYYISYTFTTISLVDDVWQDITEERKMEVAKDSLGEYVDLGLYVTQQLQEVIDKELSYLREVQSIEKQLVTNKVVATAYSGLVGALLDDTTEEIPGYEPVVTPPPPPPPPPSKVASSDSSDTQSSGEDNEASTPTPTTTSTTSGNSEDPHPPHIDILGNNPARITVGSNYNDLGAVVTDNKDLNLGLTKYVNGVEMQVVSISTSEVATHEVRYSATDNAGNTTNATRIVEVYDPFAPTEPLEENTATSTESASESTEEAETATSTEEVVPEPQPEPASETESATTTPESAEAVQEEQAETATTTEEVIEEPVVEDPPAEEEPPSEPESVPEEEPAPEETATSTESTT